MSEISSDRHIVFIIGTRAQLIKVAPIISNCEKSALPCTILMTGQHKDTMDDLFNEFSIKTEKLYATIPIERSTIFSLFAWLPKAYGGTVKQLKTMKDKYNNSDVLVLVHGDTLTTLISAYCGRRAGCKVIHIESGLTSGNYLSPFPEELIRNLVFKMTDIAFCPDDKSYRHMQKVSKATIFNTNGNTIFDAIDKVAQDNNFSSSKNRTPYVVVSIHRFNNIYHKARLVELIKKIKQVAQFISIKFVLHPATLKRLNQYQLYEILEQEKNIELLPRMSYFNFIRFAYAAECVLTDGGSNQEELAYLGVPTIVMRSHTEREDGLGSNAIMESEVVDFSDFFSLRKYTNLREEDKKSSYSPSEMIISTLQNYK
ncbi:MULTISPECIES: UDP-N-acetylglucosamine 2-epimerase [Acinetobacter]|uniref:UDP-N-acetylglucosamine 2-epimerase n=1 Tax=Acinetobacter TaxID=469 RepID=UPI000DAE6A90|nr:MULTISPECIES: UDP-N-acetylglucosamine 2-epimerase [Acinetobacter]AWV87478.1 hypothetical protein DOM24_13140 [Acinetobacter radioresistens]MCK4079340.1 UDP-N-acetyl glucosamine 2-epimerase [Acinetobacter radioresistens]MCK4107655.1 UDP-N-acetyl glucosamine 2-epimerase [Acinetobacter radioresistens]MCX0327072.1 UDP-N-acetylglucosamine 2-epimerase [Acinetobacter radioresistens]MCX0342013.1 UDP-N-acetylglucosamine 2-epimerase [Acinetobacter radioresistens]